MLWDSMTWALTGIGGGLLLGWGGRFTCVR